MKTKELNQKALSFTEKQLILLQEEHDIDDEMNEEETKELNDDPYFLLAQRLANAPQVKVRSSFSKYLLNKYLKNPQVMSDVFTSLRTYLPCFMHEYTYLRVEYNI